MENVVKQNKMATMPVFKLLISMSLPMIISMLVQSLYNLVDSIYVGHFSQSALTAVGLCFPFQNLVIAFATGIGVGINAILSKSLGENNKEKASKTATNGLVLISIVALLFVLLGLLLVKPYMHALSSNSEVIKYGEQYLSIVICVSFGCFYAITFERLLQSTGLTLFSMITQLVGAITNIVLDYVLIFPCGLGVRGAAIATVIGQIFSATLGLIFNLKINKEISLSFKGFKLDKEIIKEVLLIGIPSVIMSAIASVLTFLFNIILGAFDQVTIPGHNEVYGDHPQTVFGIYFKLNGVFFMPVFGLNNGLVPIIAYNYGAKRKDKLMKTLKYATIIAFIMMLIGTLLFLLIPEQLITMFIEDKSSAEELILTGVPCLRIIALSFVIASVNIVLSSAFQALGHGFYSMIISILRQLIILLPVAFLFSLTKKLELVWFSYLIAECFALMLSIYLFYRVYHHKIKLLGQ